MNKERYESLSAKHQKIIDEISGMPFSMQLVQAFHDADEVALKWKDEKIAAGELNVEWIVTSDRERAKMEAAAAAGMEAIYSDYADRGIQNAQTIYEALNK